MSKYVIAVDAMGGDNAPNAVVDGAIRALRRFSDISVILTGDESKIRPMTSTAEDVADRLEIVHTTQVIEMEEAPMVAVRTKRDSSMVVAMNLVREGKAHAAVSAGSTGAVLACGMFKIGRIQGIERPVLGPVLPAVKGNFILVDSGANVDCQSKFLLQFGLMGSVYMKNVLGIENPRVGLINVGAEAEKGNKMTKEAHELMINQSAYNFAGNCEARDVFSGNYDVIVADGFDGNIILKQTEGMIKAIFTMMKEEIGKSGLFTKIGAALVKPVFKSLKDKMDYNKVGGAPLLGVEGAVVKAHGSSGDEAFENAIAQARSMLAGNVVEKIREGLGSLNGNL